MLKVNKKDEPQFFTEFKRKKSPKNWDELDKPENHYIKKELKYHMLKNEQNIGDKSYCPYCEIILFSENNYFRATKEPILISRQGNDANGAGKFSGEPGGMIKEYGSIFAEKGTAESYSPITYAANNKSFDFFQATSRDEKVPSSVVSLNGGNTYNNFDTTSSLMYFYTPDATSMVPEGVTGYYGAGRLNHGSLKFKFDNAVEDNNSAPIPALEALIDNYTGK